MPQLPAEFVEDLEVAGGFVLVVLVPVVDRDLHDDERLLFGHEFFGHERSPRCTWR
jgi:hypothetical protein